MSVSLFIQSSTAAVAGVTAMAYYRYKDVMKRQQMLPQSPLLVFDDDEKRNSIEKNEKSAIVIGAGVVGVATAYQLAKRGYSVAVLEPMDAPGEECSACAAGGMQRSNPVVDRDSWVAVAKCLVPHWMRPSRHYDFFHINWLSCLTDPFFLRWVATFTRTSLFPDEQQASKQHDMLDFTDYAVQEMVKMLQMNRGYLGMKSGYNTRGSLAVSYDKIKPPSTTDLNNEVISTSKTTAKSNPTQSKRNLEPSKILLDTGAVLLEEPSLRFQEQLPTSAKFEYDSKAASSGRFSKALAEICQDGKSRAWKLNNGGRVRFFYGTRVQGIETLDSDDNGVSNDSDPSKAVRLLTNNGVIDCTCPGSTDLIPIVIATGAWVPHIMALMNFYAPVYPLTGYAMSVSAKEAVESPEQIAHNGEKLTNTDLPSRIVCDKYMYTTRLGPEEIRITSIGEFSGWSTEPTPSVEKEFRDEASRQFPQLTSLILKSKVLCGHRPLVNDGILLLGHLTPSSNVYISCGPGSNGWKLAMGSGEVVARMIEGHSLQQVSQDLGANVETFAPAGRILYSPWFTKICRARWNF